jgi:hypothetical protein
MTNGPGTVGYGVSDALTRGGAGEAVGDVALGGAEAVGVGVDAVGVHPTRMRAASAAERRDITCKS